MTSWTAQTRQNKISVTSYAYKDTAITGFIGTHQPAIWMGDFGYVSLMPEVDEIKTTFARRFEAVEDSVTSLMMRSRPRRSAGGQI